MRPIIFCNIAYMKYYKGVAEEDKPKFGGSWVEKHEDAHESNNFNRVTSDILEKDFCLGFVRLGQSVKNKSSEFHIEKIYGCNAMKNEETVDGVTVVWCSKSKRYDGVRVVGWYNNATVYRNEQYVEFDNGDYQCFNFSADADDCVLLPYTIRGKLEWEVPRSGHDGYDFGFGRANLWYCNGVNDNPRLKAYIEKLLKTIDEYEGENWLDERSGC